MDANTGHQKRWVRLQPFAIRSATAALIICNFGFFFLYLVDLKAVVLALLYFGLVICLPGWLLSLLIFHICRADPNDRPAWDLLLPLTTVLGFALVLVSYLLAQLAQSDLLIYLFIAAYGLMGYKPVREQMLSAIARRRRQESTPAGWKWPTVLFFILCLNVTIFSLRPTPGILPLDIYPDKLWNAGNTTALTSGFPLYSMNIETRPVITYHILYHILGAHMALTTGLLPHMVALQYIFVPLVPLMVLCMTALLHQFFRSDTLYLAYGLALLLFGGGFHMVHEVKAQNLGSSTNFVGVILLFAMITVLVQLSRFRISGRSLLIFTGVFLATAAKGSIGACLCAGIGLWVVLQFWKRAWTAADIGDGAAALLGFGSSLAMFFIWPAIHSPAGGGSSTPGGFPLIPLTYVTKNDLLAPLVNLLYKLLPGALPLLGHVAFTVLVLPFYILFYYSYRLLVLYDYKINGGSEKIKRVLLVVLGSLTFGYLLDMKSWQNHAYMLTSAIFMLDVLFIAYVQRERLLSRIRDFFRQRQIFACVGAFIIALLPFITIPGWIRAEHTHNVIMFSRIGQLLNRPLSHTTYRKERSIITPQLYQALQFIRTSTDPEAVVVTPIMELPNGRPAAFYTSAFSERTAYVEGFYGGEDVTLYVDRQQVEQRQALARKMYSDFVIPDELLNKKYLILAPVEAAETFAAKYPTIIRYRNGKWSVIQVIKK